MNSDELRRWTPSSKDRAVRAGAGLALAAFLALVFWVVLAVIIWAL